MSAAVEIFGLSISHTGPAPYVARSASDRDPDWPVWYVSDAVGFNGIRVEGMLTKFFDQDTAKEVADALNAASQGGRP